jgi:hypothetical protein
VQAKTDKRYVSTDNDPAKPIGDDISDLDSGYFQADKAACNFINLLMWMKLVFLQDAALLQDEFPENPMFTHEVFCHPSWVTYKAAVLAHVQAAENARTPSDDMWNEMVS